MPQSTNQNLKNNPRVKIFLWGSVILIILAVISFIAGIIFLSPEPRSLPVSEIILSNQTKKEPIAKKETSSDPNMFVTKAPERQKVIYPPISFIDPQLGSQDAPITIIEFSDFNCPYCAQVQPTLAELFIKYPEQIRLVWKNLPIKQLHPSAELAAEAALCADEQDKFWEYHDLLFANQDYHTKDDLIGFAQELNLNTNNFSNCLENGTMKPRVDKSIQEAEDLLINSTPHFYINQQEISGAADLEDFIQIIEIELNK